MGYWGVKNLGCGIWAPLCHPPPPPVSLLHIRGVPFYSQGGEVRFFFRKKSTLTKKNCTCRLYFDILRKKLNFHRKKKYDLVRYRSMKGKKSRSSGHDDISSKLLKSFKNKITYPLSILINNSLSNGIVDLPETMKIAKVIPL